MSSIRQQFLDGLRAGIPIALGYLGVSFSFGILGTGARLAWWETLLISLTNLTSAGQFAGLQIMIGGGALLEMALGQLVINSRYSLMGIALSQKTDSRFRGVFRWLFGFGITDEIFAVAAARAEPLRRSFFAGLMFLPYCGWGGGTLLGAVCGKILPDVITEALGVALYGMFIALFVPAMRIEKRMAAAVLMAVGISCFLAYSPAKEYVSGGFAVIICTVVASAVGALFFPLPEDGNPENPETEGGRA